MSSSSPPPPLTISSVVPTGDSTSSATSSPTPTSNGGSSGPSSSLYLFTFLATLFLLLFVSSAIILRSFILRRRFRRHMEEAILNGVIVPHHTRRVSRRHANREKPKLWEARVSPAENDRWDTIVPVSALPISSGQHGKAADADVDPITSPSSGEGEGQAAAVPAAPLPQPTPSPRQPLHRRPWLRNPFSRRRATLSPSGPGPVPPNLEPTDRSGLPERQQQNATSSVHDQLQVTVLIAMPDPRRPHQDGTALASHSKGKERSLDFDYDEDDVPDMALGMTELQYTDTIATPKSP